MRYENVLIHEGVAHDNNPPGPGSGRYPWGSGERQYQHEERIVIKDTIKLDDLKTKEVKKIKMGSDSVSKSDIKLQSIKSDEVKQKSNLGAEQTRVDNPSGNGTIPFYKKDKKNKKNKKDNGIKYTDKVDSLRYQSGQGQPWRDKYYTSSTDIKQVIAKGPPGNLASSAGQMYSGINSIIKGIHAYEDGKLDDKARKRLDKRIRKLTDDELSTVYKRINTEKNLIEASNSRNQQTMKKGKSYIDIMVQTIGDQVKTALGVAGMIVAIKKITGH